MNKKSLFLGVAITVIWIGFITCIFLFAGMEQPKSLNELGDFLAGVFAPIAFFWLILGYMQQGKQLDQNTKALQQQERALQLQINEMKESVEQQAKLAGIQQLHFDAMNSASKPNLLIDACDCEIYSGSEWGDLCRITPKIYNKGVGEALDVKIDVRGTIFLLSSKILVDGLVQESIDLKPDLIYMSRDSSSLTISMTLIYNNKFNYEIREYYEVEINFIIDSWEVEKVFIVKQ